MARFLILDSEALSALANPRERGAQARRAQAVLASAHRCDALVRVPAPVLVETCRGTARDAAVSRVLRHIPVVPTDTQIARRAGALLDRHGLDSRHAVDAIVVATAIRLGGGLVATGDPDDIRLLASGFANVRVVAI